MGNLAKLKLAIGQPQLVDGRPRANEAATDRMVDRAVDAGADVLVLPGSLSDARDIRLIGLNDTRVDLAGNVAVIDACGETYRIGMGGILPDCDFGVIADTRPYSIVAPAAYAAPSAIVLRPVGIRDVGNKVLAYDGGSAAYGADGAMLARLADGFSEDLAILSHGPSDTGSRQGPEKLLSCLVTTMRRFDELALPWRPRWIIGLSGGLDSSVVAAILALAFGPDRVLAYNMASRFNSEATKANAAHLAQALGIELRSGSIAPHVEGLETSLRGFGYDPAVLSGLVLENAQARARGNLLSAFSAIEGGVVVNNGNRVEAALGYATLYGDAIGALAPIGDLTKVQLFDVAHAVNARFGSQVVSDNLLPRETDTGYEWDTMPSAELADGQRDPMKWFYHDWLVGQLLGDGRDFPLSLDDAACDVMERYLDDGLARAGMAKWIAFYGLDDPRAFIADLDWVLKGMRGSAFKRIQSPPKIAVASPASIAEGPATQITPEPSQRFNVLRASVLAL